MNTSGDVVMGTQAVFVPPSPGLQNPFIRKLKSAPGSRARPARKLQGKHANDRTGAGVKKQRAKPKTPDEKMVEATVGATAALSISAVEKPFRFMELPGGKLIPCDTVQNLICNRDPQPHLPIHVRASEASAARASPTHGFSPPTYPY